MTHQNPQLTEAQLVRRKLGLMRTYSLPRAPGPR
jgi:hypothetical protein